MSLTAALNTAKSSLATSAEQTSILARNVARVGDPTASRKYAEVLTTPGYGVRLASVSRVVDVALGDPGLPMGPLPAEHLGHDRRIGRGSHGPVLDRVLEVRD